MAGASRMAAAIGAAALGWSGTAQADPATDGKAVTILQTQRMMAQVYCGSSYLKSFARVDFDKGSKELLVGKAAFQATPIAYAFYGTHATGVVACLDAKSPTKEFVSNVTTWMLSSDLTTATYRWYQSQYAMQNNSAVEPLPGAKKATSGPAPQTGDPAYVRFKIFGRTETRLALVQELIRIGQAMKLQVGFPFMDVTPRLVTMRNDHVAISIVLTQKDNCAYLGRLPDTRGCTGKSLEDRQQWLELAVIGSTSDATAAHYKAMLDKLVLSPPPPPPPPPIH